MNIFQIGLVFVSRNFGRLTRFSNVVARRRLDVGDGVGKDGQQPQQQRRQFQSGDNVIKKVFFFAANGLT
jgi:hypothetical protein